VVGVNENVPLRLRVNTTALLIRNLAVIASTRRSRAVCDRGAGELVLDVVVDAGFFDYSNSTSGG